MVEEMESMHKNEMWVLVEILNGRKPIGSNWVFNKKLNTTNQFKKFKARLVVKGYSKVEGVDFGEIFPPIAKLTSVIVLMSLNVTFHLEIDKMDVKTTFLHGGLEK
jgi:hypothetical protein